jgi:hypothetical protein
VIGVDPRLVDPEHGDYRLAPDSPAAGYGCRTFGRRTLPRNELATAPLRPPNAPGRETIEVSGAITRDTVWDAETVRVVGDVTVEDGVTLTIAPGVLVESADYYRLNIAGTLVAVGAPDRRIVFTTDDPQDFAVNSSHAGCWNGIRFDGTSATNADSILAYCTIQYSKATGGGGGVSSYGGGAVSAVDFSKLTIENCIFRANVADYGGALFLYRNANPLIVGNLMVDNHALQNAAVIYCAYSHPVLTNNTFVSNRIHNQQNPYIESCALLSFISKPVLTDNIFRDNDPFSPYLHTQLWENKDYHTHYNNIEGGEALGGNFDADPLFAVPGHWDDQGTQDWSDDIWSDGDYRLLPGSPCVDAGATYALPPDMFDLNNDGDRYEPLPLDLAGQARLVDDPETTDTGDGEPPVVDLGAYEYQPPSLRGDLNCDGRCDGLDIAPFALALTDPSGYQAAFPGCDIMHGDLDASLTVDGADIQPFVDLFLTP